MTTMSQRNITTTENADLLRDRCEALEYMLEQCIDVMRAENITYVEAQAFSQGRMSVADALALKEQDA